MNFYSPLRYPGGKGKVASFFNQLVSTNFIDDGIYVEPYAGGASVALYLLFNESVSKVIINDVDKSIFAFWYCVLNKTEELCRLINEVPVTIETWKEQKRIQKNKNKAGIVKLGFSTFFLNRTNRSGILNAGVIGGQKQISRWKMDARYNKTELVNRIKRISAYKDRIELHNTDALDLIKFLRKTLPEKTLFFLDPPYYIKGKDLYLNHYKERDHKKIATEMSKVKKQKWVVTYDSVEPIRKLYYAHRQKTYTLNYSAGQPIKGEEVMIFSDNLNLPMRLTIH